MRELKGDPPFKFDLRSLVTSARKVPVKLDGVTISLPFVSFTVKPDKNEKKIAREIVIRLADRRVLNAFECCDGCIKNAIESLLEIRQILVDKQVDLSDDVDGPLYLLVESIKVPIKQFLTFEQKIRPAEDHRNRETYFVALEMLRAHIHRTLIQIAKLADMEIPGIVEHMRYSEDWQLVVYEEPKRITE